MTYTRTAILLHWLVALLIFAAFPLGMYMADLPFSPNKLQLFSYHKWIGITVLLLVAIRLAWRATHAAPPAPAGPRWQQVAATAVHHLLYVLMLVVPLSGWLMSSAKGFQTVWFGVLPLPDLVAKDKALGDLLREVHELLNYTLLALVAAHVGAALKHHFIDKDGLLDRMRFKRA
ncbi:cytochrome b561 [Oryzomicrobium terrae]|uniref:Cytochrome b561 n=1 Tax=Oryzomicrobium terrae TaxID=1735038 RepID=A0A5C1E9J6_9RHOO|nr:cytochrome b [Oryzomicrobium terrae]QEL64827.1 cytochrome b561 [Oryzomicrobium terrae]